MLQEKRVDDHWNVDVDRSLSDSWTGFTKFTLLNEKPSEGYMWSGERLTKIQATTRPEYEWPQIWIGMSKAAQKEEEERAIEKPKLENARKLRDIYFIDQEDEDYKETIKKLGKSWRILWRRRCHAKWEQRSTWSCGKPSETDESNKIHKTKAF